MNWPKKGPELKQIKAPAFATDLYQDLRDRRLLLPLALVLVAIAAVPFLLGDSETEVPPPVTGTVGAADSGNDRAGRLAVVEATPGLRDYKKRLGDRTESNPFKQQHTGVPKSAQLESTGSSSGGSGGGSSGETLTVDETSSGSVDVEVQPGGGGGRNGGTLPGSNGNSGERLSGRFFAYRPNLRFGPLGSNDLNVYKQLPLGTLLPKEKPLIIFIGASENGNRVSFDLSREVTKVVGPGRCVGGKDDCGLLILRAGQAVNLLTESPDRSFRLHVVAIDFVEVERPKPANSSSTGPMRWDAGLSHSFSK